MIVVGGLALTFFISGPPSWAGFGSATATAAEPMELSGSWLGMRLAAPGTSTASRFGIPPNVSGVVVAEMLPVANARGAAGGIVPGDVITSINGTNVTNLADLYSMTQKLDATQPMQVAIMRQGQSFALTLPPTQMPPMMGGPMMGAPGVAAMQPMPMQPMAAPAPMPMQPMALPAPMQPMPMQPMPMQPMPMQPVPAQAQPPVSGQFFCPNDGLIWSQAQVQPHFRCPRCGGGLTTR